MVDEVKKQKNLKALVDIHHVKPSVTAQRSNVIRKGSVVDKAVFLPGDIKHFLNNGHMEETDEAVTSAGAAPEGGAAAQNEPASELDKVEE